MDTEQAASRAQRLRALIPDIYKCYWRAHNHAEEHRALVLVSAISLKYPPCHQCGTLSPSEWLNFGVRHA